MSTNTTIVCLGDSLTAMGGWCDAIGERFGCRVINAGVGGDTSVQGLARFEQDVAPHHPDIVIIGFGTNDQVIYDPEKGPQVNLQEFKSTLATLISRSYEIGASHVFLLTPCAINMRAYYTRHPEEWYNPYHGVGFMMEDYRNVVRELAKETDAILIDVGAFSLARPEKVLGVPGDEGFDGVHPSAEGFALYAKWIGDTLENVL